uniref:Clp1 P-loop domain-containing protein n=1 Tax=Oryza meridionalis TaxID=40149 RepID=A0A0E0BYB9_9ORYZ
MAGASPSARAEVVVPPGWAAATATASSEPAPPVVVVCGPKNAGKSTFSRLLLNSLLPRYGRVGYLDTDVGQPEFSPPGCLSFHVVDEALTDLLNPTLRECQRCCFFGDISSKRDPETYLNCLFHLYDYFVENYRSGASEPLPLIVNTPGWIRISAQSKNLPDGMFWLDCGQTGPNMINIDAPFHDALNRSLLIQKDSYGMRERRLIEYFKQCFSSDISLTTNKELAYALTSLPPYEVSISDVMVPPSEVRGCVSPYMPTNVLHRISERDINT